MRKFMPTIAVLFLMLALLFPTLIYADKIDEIAITEPPEPQQVQIIKVRATAFNEYGHDSNGIDYGPGYVIISSQSEIPIYSLLDIDVYGPCQAVATSDRLAKDEIQLWYNAPSKVPMFGQQEAFVRVLEEGDRPETRD